MRTDLGETPNLRTCIKVVVSSGRLLNGIKMFGADLSSFTRLRLIGEVLRLSTLMGMLRDTCKTVVGGPHNLQDRVGLWNWPRVLGTVILEAAQYELAFEEESACRCSGSGWK